MLARLRSLLTQPAIVSSAIITALMVGIKQLGVVEPIELKLFDQMIQMRTDQSPDPRILVVAVTENDIQKLQEWPLSGETINKLFTKLERYQPRAIGLDIFRDLPVEPGHARLLQHLKQSDRIVPICQHGAALSPATPPPAGIEPERVGFSDIVEDSDGIIRRSLLSVTPAPASACATPYSLSLQLALDYLAEDRIEPKSTPQGDLQIGKTIFKRLQRDSGGYQQVDAQGYQILLNYRSPNQVANQVSLTEVLSDQVEPALVKDRIILIGATASSLRDVFNTPYSAAQQEKMPGIILHAQMASQVLSTVLDGRPLFWFWPEWGESLWIWGWTLTGGIIAWRIQHPLSLGLAVGTALIALLGSYFAIFTQTGWVPIVPPALGLVLATGSVVAYTAFQTKQQQEKIAQQVQEQEKIISLLQTLLKEGEETSINNLSTVNRLQHDTLLNNRYRVTKPLSSGGFSHTYLAQDTQRPSNPVCVVKHLQPARNDPQFLEVARRLFKTEAEILELLGQNERIPQLFAYFEENQQFYLVQEFIEGHSLNDELTSGKRLSETEVVKMLKEVLQILVFVHSNQVIHRDIKPSNLMRRDRDKHIFLIDFGAVKQIQPQQTEEESHTVAVGTTGYAPPEQFMGRPRLNSDIYALGMVGIQALTGIPANQLQQNQNTGEFIWHHLAESRGELATILDKMVSYNFQARYQSAGEVLQSLEKL